MKKLAITFIFVMLGSCANIRKPQETEDKAAIAEKKKNSHLVDLCSYENLPRFPYRPKLYPQELKNLTEEQMDARIKAHIKALDEHIDKVENTVVETRRRVEMCR